jgi:hypothetical protein
MQAVEVYASSSTTCLGNVCPQDQACTETGCSGACMQTGPPCCPNQAQCGSLCCPTGSCVIGVPFGGGLCSCPSEDILCPNVNADGTTTTECCDTSTMYTCVAFTTASDGTGGGNHCCDAQHSCAGSYCCRPDETCMNDKCQASGVIH